MLWLGLVGASALHSHAALHMRRYFDIASASCDAGMDWIDGWEPLHINKSINHTSGMLKAQDQPGGVLIESRQVLFLIGWRTDKSESGAEKVMKLRK